MHFRRVGGEILRRWGQWNKDACEKSYLLALPTEGLLAAGEWPDWDTRTDQYFHPRFMVEVPMELIYKMAPGWKEIENTVLEVSIRGCHARDDFIHEPRK